MRKSLANKIEAYTGMLMIIIFSSLMKKLPLENGLDFNEQLAVGITEEIFGCYSKENYKFAIENKDKIKEQIDVFGKNYPHFKTPIRESLRCLITARFIKGGKEEIHKATQTIQKCIDNNIILPGGKEANLLFFYDMIERLAVEFKASNGNKEILPKIFR